MRRDRFYIGVAIFMVMVVAMFLGLYIIGQQKRNVAVEALKAKAARVVQHSPTPIPKSDADTEELPKPQSPEAPIPEANSSLETQEERQAAFETLGEKLTSLYKDTKPEDDIIWDKYWTEWTPEELELVAKYLEEHQELLEEIERLANTDGPLYDFDLDEGYWNNYEIQNPTFFNYPHAYYYRVFARFLALDAYVATARGDYETAIDNHIMIINLANKTKNDPAAICQGTRIATVSFAYTNVNAGIHGEELSLDTLQRFVAAAYDTGDREAFGVALATEGVLNLAQFESVRDHNYNYGPDEMYAGEAFLMYFYGSVLARPLLNMDEDVYASTMNRVSDATALPYYEAKPIFDQIEEDIAALPRTRILSRMLLPNITSFADAQARHEATLGLMQVGLSIEHYHGQHGVYPETLEEIAPILNGPIPIDPYTGQPFVYEPGQDEFTLYSARGSVVGPGRPVPPYYNAQGNIVWRYTGE